MKIYCVYILTNRKNGTLYIGVTGNLQKRIWEHKNKSVKGFTSKYCCDKLVYFEQTENVISALNREKQIKKWKRAWKVSLVEEDNSDWRDLYEDL
ncbi:MAG: GIY-YIG nuclease family protein [Candidatus Moranbacteria bacterium]|nr:GIY-YIG nuclease family protein [Candidatus Moranbacteria bacterium]